MTTITLDSCFLEQDAGTIMEQLNTQTQQATARTLKVLCLCSSEKLEPIDHNPPIFLPQSQSIAPGYTDIAPQEVTDYLEKLVRAAQQTAESHCCGSFVAGQLSESDEFADVGVWLGPLGNYQRNHEREILYDLGLLAWADDDIDQMEGLYDEKLKVEDSETSAMGKLLDSLEDCHRFLVRRQDSYFACFLVGRLKGQGSWCGLASIGVAT
ncbi:hypothetical protein DFH29DRAFT_891920 [Suillus ampliporus]|nr:hypothetical protein DFH29DRAFT_891920 [Suillus ampliporus]